MQELIFSHQMDLSTLRDFFRDADEKKVMFARSSQFVTMNVMVCGYLRMSRTGLVSSANGRNAVAAYITIGNVEYELADGDVVRTFKEHEHYDAFMMVVGNQGRISVTESPGMETKDLI